MVHVGVRGPMRTVYHGHSKYFILFIDYYSRMTWVYFTREKFEVFLIFKKFRNFVKKQTSHCIKILRRDKGKKYTSNTFQECGDDEKVQRQLTVSYTQQQKGVFERKNQTAMEMAKCIFHDKRVPKEFWAETFMQLSIYSK